MAIALKQCVSGHEAKPRQSLLITLIGTFLLWFGWFGFNGGSALSAGYLAAQALVTSTVAASAGALMWLVLELRRGESDFIGVAIGSIVGLVAITPACGYVHVLPAIVIGAVGSALSFWAVRFVKSRGIDDRLDVFASHGVAGAWGAIATGIFADIGINPAGANGLLQGNLNLLGVQAFSVLVVAGYTFVVSVVLAKVLQKTMGFSVSETNVPDVRFGTIPGGSTPNIIADGDTLESEPNSMEQDSEIPAASLTGKKYRRQYRPLWTRVPGDTEFKDIQ